MRLRCFLVALGFMVSACEGPEDVARRQNVAEEAEAVAAVEAAVRERSADISAAFERVVRGEDLGEELPRFVGRSASV